MKNETIIAVITATAALMLVFGILYIKYQDTVSALRDFQNKQELAIATFPTLIKCSDEVLAMGKALDVMYPDPTIDRYILEKKLYLDMVKCQADYIQGVNYIFEIYEQ